MELFESIRREYQFGVGTIKGVAQKFGVHRRMVREALADAVPKQRRRAERARPKLEPAVSFIDEILKSYLQAPRKQRHTAHRIYNRLCIEKPDVKVAEATVRAYVRERKLQIGLIHRETFVPQSYTWGQEGQVDWYEMVAELGGERQKVQIFCPQYGECGSVSSCLSARQPAGVSGSARTGVPIFRRGFPGAEIRQSEVGGAENPAGLATRGDGAFCGLPIALGV